LHDITLIKKWITVNPTMKPVNEPPRGRTRKGAGAVALTGLNRNDIIVTYQY
jgi:hypothetical protein